MPMQHVQDTRIVPLNAIGLLEMKFDDGETYTGSGVLIDPVHVLTCSHNLIENLKQGNAKATAITFYPGYNSTSEPQPSQGIAAAAGFYASAYRQNDDSWDIAVVRLSKAYPLDIYFTPFPLTSDSPPANFAILAGYPGTHEYEMWMDDSEPFAGLNIQDHVFAYLHDTEAGNSGSPVFLYDKISKTVRQYGVHTGKAKDDQGHFVDGLKKGVLITATTRDFINAAKQSNPNGAFLVGL